MQTSIKASSVASVSSASPVAAASTSAKYSSADAVHSAINSLVASSPGLGLSAAAISSSATAAAAGGADERALLMLLQDEVKRLHNSKSEKNNEMRTLLEMKVAMEQLEAVTEQRRRLTEDVAKERASTEKLKERIAALDADAVLKAEQRKVKEHHLGEEIHDLKQRLERATASESGLRGRLEAAERELGLTKDRAVSAKKEYTAAEQVNFETTTILKTKLTQALAEIDSLREQARYDGGQAKEHEYSLSQAVSAATRERRAVQADLAQERRAHIEDVADLKRALHEAQQSQATMQDSYSGTHRLDQEKLIRLTSELQLLKEKANADAAAAAARERVLDEQNMKMVADLRSAQAEINAMASQEWVDKKALTQRLIEVTVARDVALQSNSELREKTTLAQQDNTATVAQLQNELTRLRATVENEGTRRTRAAQDEQRRVVELETKLKLSEADCEKLQRDAQRSSNETERLIAVRDSELNSARIELRATVETLHRLERQVQDNMQVKLLMDENASLREQCEALKTRVVEMTSNLANMRAEADISENVRVSSIQGLVADYHQRIVALEKEQRFSRPLIKDLAALCQKHSVLDSVLERDVELYNANFLQL